MRKYVARVTSWHAQVHFDAPSRDGFLSGIDVVRLAVS